MSFSSLYVSGKYASHTVHKMFQAIKPIFDLKQMCDPSVFSSIRNSIIKREGSPFLTVSVSNLDSIQDNVKKLIELNNQISSLIEEREQYSQERRVAGISPEEDESLKKKQISLTERITPLREACFPLEELAMPVILNLPNRVHGSVPEEETVLLEANMNLKKRKRLFKQLDFRQLSYINESVYSSLIGPDSRFAAGRIARLHYSLTEFICNHFRNECNFNDFSGMDMVKSAVVEAVRCREDRDYQRDFYQIDRGYDGQKESQQLHLAGEASLESVSAFISRLVFMKSIPESLRLFASGPEYDVDKEDNRMVQKHSVRSYSLLTGNDDDAENDKIDLLQRLWPLYSSFQVPTQAVSVPAPFLLPNEASRTDIKVFLPSDNDWIRTGYISNLTDFVPRRLGICDRQLVTGVIHIEPIVTSIIETHQTQEGSFKVPEVLDMFA